MRILLGIVLFFTAFLALSYIVGRFFTSLIAGQPQKTSVEKSEKENSPKTNERAKSNDIRESSFDNRHNNTDTRAEEKARKIKPELTNKKNTAVRFENKIVQLHNAEIHYANTTHSSYDKCLTTLGVFEDPFFIDYGGRNRALWIFQKTEI